MSVKEAEGLQIILTIVSVKMKIKFPCRMALEFNKQTITKETSPSENHKFQFNEELTLKTQTDNQNFEILVNLFTDKGTKYTSGTIKLLGGELSRSKGERLIVPIAKCLDSEAFCEVRVDSVNSLTRSQLHLKRTGSKVLMGPQKVETPPQESKELKKISSERYLLGQTRSEANLHPMMAHGFDEGRREQGPKSQIFKTFTKSPTNKFSNIKYVSYNGGGFNPKMGSEFPVEEVNSTTSPRMTFAQNEVYREGYNKLKEKYKRQSELLKEESHKRMLLETNQNNYKLQIMKLKMRCEEQDKQLTEKNQKIRVLNNTLNELQKKDLDLAYLREECSSLQRKVEMKEESIQALSRDNQALKKLMSEKSTLNSETIKNLRGELQLAKSKVDEQKYEYDLALQAKDNILTGKNNDIELRNDTINRQKQLVKQLEQQAENKLFEFEKTLTLQKNALQKKIDELRGQISLMEASRREMNSNLTTMNLQNQKLRNNIQSLEYARKVMEEEGALMRSQIGELRMIKERYTELTKQHKLLNDQFATVRKNLELTLSNKEGNLNELIAKYEEGKTRAEKNRGEQEQKIKNLLNKNQQVELNCESLKVALEKAKRINDNLSKQNGSLRQQNTLIRQQLRLVESRLINVEGDYSTINSKFQREEANYTFLLTKYKDEKNHLEVDNEVMKSRLEKLEETRKEYAEKSEEWRAKERHLQQRIEKEQISHREITSKWEHLNLELQQTLGQTKCELEEAVRDKTTLKQQNNELEITAIKTKQTIERLRKELKVNEEKCVGLQLLLGQKNDELVLSQQLTHNLEQKLQEKEQNYSVLKEQHHEEISKSAKKSKMNEMIASDLKKANKNIEELTNDCKTKDQTEETLRKQIKTIKQDFAKEKLRANKIQNDFQKFKEVINDIIRLQFTKILKTPISTEGNTERLRQSAVSKAGSSKSLRDRQLDASGIANVLIERLQQVKGNVSRLGELSRVLKQENMRLMEQSQSDTHRYEFAQVEMQRDIQLLEDEVDTILTDKQAECQNYDNLLVELNFKIKERENDVAELQMQIEEYENIIRGLRSDFETNNDLNQKKVATLKTNINELNERIDYLNLNVACLEDKNHELEEKVIEHQNEIVNCKELLIKNQKSLIDCQENEGRLARELENSKKEVKTIHEAASELEIQINTERQTKEKYKFMLEEEEKKAQKMNEFVSGLIQQKEAAIKSQLERSEQVNNVENQLFEVTHQRDMLVEENAKCRKKIEEMKEELKIVGLSLKQTEKQLSEEKLIVARGVEKVKERDSDIEIKKEYIKDLEEKYRELRDKNYKEIRELSSELEDKNMLAVTLGKELNQKIFKIQNQNKKVWEDNMTLKGELEEATQHLYAQRDRSEDLQIEVRGLKQQKVTLQDELASKEFIVLSKTEELNKLQVMLFDQRQQMEQLSEEFNSNQRQFNLNITELTNQFNFKMETNNKEYQQKLQLTNREIDYLREKLKDTELTLENIESQKKTQLVTSEQTKKTYEEKLKKMENDRLNGISVKNAQIKKLAEENKGLLEKIRDKQSQVRRLGLELEQIKLTLTRTEAMTGHNLEQGKNRERVLEKEIEALKLQVKQFYGQKERMMSILRSNEMEVRKLIVSVVKKTTEVCSKSEAEKIIFATKGLQSSVIQAMTNRFDQQ